ncbi:hypothetical protein AMECASPLE_035987 [Ameca splendens]|uniref:Uncharacterized protein n=1 Tax=Ameca splendens TaxID=208324 RepID=A0ABV0XKP5_9TELE
MFLEDTKNCCPDLNIPRCQINIKTCCFCKRSRAEKARLSQNLYENCPIFPPRSTPPIQTSITNTERRKFKKDEGKRTVGTVHGQMQEMPSPSNKCCSCIKDDTGPNSA